MSIFVIFFLPDFDLLSYIFHIIGLIMNYVKQLTNDNIDKTINYISLIILFSYIIILFRFLLYFM